MIESKAPLSDEPLDLIEQSDLVDILRARIPEESSETDSKIQLLEISDNSLHREIFNRGQFSREDLEDLLKHEETLQSAVEFLAVENSRLVTVAKSKEDKIHASIDMIVSQRDWVHSLLDDNIALRTEVDRFEKEKNDFNADTEYKISALKNDKEELEEKVSDLIKEHELLESQVIEFEDQIKKSTGVLKKSQLHKNALSEKIVSMEASQLKWKVSVGVLGAVAAVFIAIAVVSSIGSKAQTTSNNNDGQQLSSIGNSANSLTDISEDNEVVVAPVNLGPTINVPADGFVTTDSSEPVIVDINTKVLDDKSVSEILNQTQSTLTTTDTTKIAKNTTVKKDKVSKPEIAVVKPVKTTPEVVKPTKPELAVVKTFKPVVDSTKPEKPEVAVVKPTKTVGDKAKVKKPEVAVVKKAKKGDQTYVIKEKDSLYAISKKFYGSGDYVNKIKKDNKLGGGLVPGKKLIISSLDGE